MRESSAQQKRGILATKVANSVILSEAKDLLLAKAQINARSKSRFFTFVQNDMIVVFVPHTEPATQSAKRRLLHIDHAMAAS